MELASQVNSWKRILNLLSDNEQPVTKKLLEDAAKIFEHLPPEVPPRLKKDHDQCSENTEKILSHLFEKIDLTDKQLLNYLLNAFIAYGNFKIAQIIYSVDNYCRCGFTFESSKWYALTPLLPEPGEFGWKHILGHGLVIEERQLYQTCLRLLTQKLHFYAIVLFSNYFDESKSQIKKNGQRVAEKLTEKIRDFAHDDEEMIGIDSYLFNLLLPFTTNEQQVDIIEATVLDRFKYILTNDSDYKPNKELIRIRNLICDCIMDKAHLQEALVVKLLEHLKCNIIRRKRRHSVEGSLDNVNVTLESMITDILNGVELANLVDKINEVEISSKRLQASYLCEWIHFVDDIINCKILTYKSSNSLVATCFILFLTTSNKNISDDLTVKILSLLTKALDNSGRKKLEYHFKSFGSSFLAKFTRSLLPRKDLLGVLMFMMRIGILRKDKDMLDSFTDIMPKLYNKMLPRFRQIVEHVRTGSYLQPNDMDSHLARLTASYAEHHALIDPYLNLNFYQEIGNSLVSPEADANNQPNSNSPKEDKKRTYTDIKTKLESLQERANRSQQIYQNIINQQYGAVVTQTIGQVDDIRSEVSCFKKYLIHLKALGRVSTIMLNNCDSQIYKLVLENTVSELDGCDAFDHPKVLYLLLMLESLIPRQSKDALNLKLFEQKITNISFSLIRISKSVELGPSVHLFTRAGSHKSAMSIQCCTYANCFRVFALIFNRFPFKITNPFLPDAIQICVSCNLARYANNSVRLHNLFIQLASSMCSLLKSIGIGRKEGAMLKSSMPLYMSTLSLLIRCLIMASDRQRIRELPTTITNGHNENGDAAQEIQMSEVEETDDDSSLKDIFESHLELLARDIGRILNNLSYLEVKLVDYAPHFIGTYIRDTQRASCPDFVRKHIDEGVFRIFNLVDAHQKKRQEEIVDSGWQRKTSAGRASGSLFKMIFARLDQASREIFKTMHDEYNQFHRYQGKC